MADDYGDKTLPATPERRKRMRAAGHVAHSAELASAGVLLGGLVALVVTGGALLEFLAGLLSGQLSGQAWLPALAGGLPPEAMLDSWPQLVSMLSKAMLPVLAVVLLLAVGLNLAQTGFLFLPARVMPDASRVSPVAGLARMVSTAGTARLGFGLVKLATISAVAVWSLHERRMEIVGAAGLDLAAVATLCWQLCLATTTKVGLSLAALAVVDYGVRRWRYERELMMTPQELREEMRHQQGDPAIAARRRSLQSQAMPEPLDVAVPKAHVVIGGGDYAVAVRYELQTMDAPALVARGAGAVAVRLRSVATESKVALCDQPKLAERLYRETPLRGPLPQSLWSEVAQVLAESRAVRG